MDRSDVLQTVLDFVEADVLMRHVAVMLAGRQVVEVDGEPCILPNTVLVEALLRHDFHGTAIEEAMQLADDL